MPLLILLPSHWPPCDSWDMPSTEGFLFLLTPGYLDDGLSLHHQVLAQMSHLLIRFPLSYLKCNPEHTSSLHPALDISVSTITIRHTAYLYLIASRMWRGWKMWPFCSLQYSQHPEQCPAHSKLMLLNQITKFYRKGLDIEEGRNTGQNSDFE